MALTLLLILHITACSKSDQPRIIPSITHQVNPLLMGVNYIFAIKGPFSRPSGIAVGSDKTLYVSDAGRSVIYILDNDGQLIDSMGRFGWREGEFSQPIDLTLDSRLLLYIADSGNDRIQKISLVSRASRVIFGKEEAGLNESHQLSAPGSISVDPSGYIYLTDTLNHRILKIDTLGRLQMELGGLGWSAQQFKNPRGIAVDRAGNIYISNTDNHRIHKLDFSGSQLVTWGQQGTSPGQFQYPAGLALDKFGNLYVLDQGNSRIQIFNSRGDFLMQFGKVILKEPMGVAVDSDLRVYVTDSESGDIKVFRVIYQLTDSEK